MRNARFAVVVGAALLVVSASGFVKEEGLHLRHDHAGAAIASVAALDACEFEGTTDTCATGAHEVNHGGD